jgi:hypothetical protein
MKADRGSVYGWRLLAGAALRAEPGTQVAHTLPGNHDLPRIWDYATD